MSNLIVQATEFSGIALLIAALVPIRSTYKTLPRGFTRFTWTFLAGLIAVCICGSILFLRLNAGPGADVRYDGLVAVVFFTAATVVFTICTMSNCTAKDIASIAVLEHAARVDPLTDLYNRRHIMNLFEAEAERSTKDGYTLSVLLLDIDRFKMINDTFGHRTGDYVLRRVSCLITELDTDCRLMGRYGGEEFLIVLPKTSQREAAQLAERIRAAVAAETISFEDDPCIPVTISIGVAASSKLNETPDELIDLADRALYAAKAGGRNMVSIATNPFRERRHAKRDDGLPCVEPEMTFMGMSRG